ncbi:HNH endonuclease [Vibrio owensii]|uniref:HNH endonuclease n=1 Tax=Vibrio owensii TaxID=696485 RepID=UPI0040692C26
MIKSPNALTSGTPGANTGSRKPKKDASKAQARSQKRAKQLRLQRLELLLADAGFISKEAKNVAYAVLNTKEGQSLYKAQSSGVYGGKAALISYARKVKSSLTDNDKTKPIVGRKKEPHSDETLKQSGGLRNRAPNQAKEEFLSKGGREEDYSKFVLLNAEAKAYYFEHGAFHSETPSFIKLPPAEKTNKLKRGEYEKSAHSNLVNTIHKEDPELSDTMLMDYLKSGTEATLNRLLSGKGGFTLTSEQENKIRLTLLDDRTSKTNKPTTKQRTQKVTTRVNQSEFREMCLLLYPSCVVTGCTLKSTLEAAHIRSVKNQGLHSSDNCLTLSRDLHAAYDAYDWSIDPMTNTIVLSDEMVGESRYKKYDGQQVSTHANASYLQEHYLEFCRQKKRETK